MLYIPEKKIFVHTIVNIIKNIRINKYPSINPNIKLDEKEYEGDKDGVESLLFCIILNNNLTAQYLEINVISV